MMRGAMRMLRLGTKSLLLHKLRAALTALGVLFGVSSVVAMLAIGEGGSYEAQEQLKALGSNNILLRTIEPPENASDSSPWQAQRYGLTYRDAEAIGGTLPAVKSVVPVRETSKLIGATDKPLPGVVIGTVPGFLDVVGLSIDEGRWLADVDVRRQSNVAVLGATAAELYYPLVNPIGRTIQAEGSRFVIVGVLDYLGRVGDGFGPSLDEGIYIPISTSRNWFGDLTVKRSGGRFEMKHVELAQIVVQVADPVQVIDTARVIREMLDDAHKEKDWIDKVPLELLRQAEEQQRIWSIVLASIAGISLLVGGIGIMNVMLATVTERTREIGIRRALGAKRRHIVSQFLVETLVLSCGGGLLGVGLGLAIPSVVEHFAELKTLVRPEHPMMAFSISALVGIVFGIYPAWRAASMDPVDALRHE
ncbi:MAG: ABC transporter permease [Planctomycetota bacterium]